MKLTKGAGRLVAPRKINYIGGNTEQVAAQKSMLAPFLNLTAKDLKKELGLEYE